MSAKRIGIITRRICNICLKDLSIDQYYPRRLSCKGCYNRRHRESEAYKQSLDPNAPIVKPLVHPGPLINHTERLRLLMIKRHL